MYRIHRRTAVSSLLGGGAAAIASLATGRGASAAARGASDGCCLEVTLTPTSRGTRLVEFVPTGVAGGQVLCTPTSQHPDNPAISSIFAKPVCLEGVHGIELTVSYLGVPKGDLSVSLLHIGLHRPTTRPGAAATK